MLRPHETWLPQTTNPGENVAKSVDTYSVEPPPARSLSLPPAVRSRPARKQFPVNRSLGLGKEAEWREFCKGNLPEKGSRPPDIPNAPHIVYEDKGWAGRGDWLGTGNVANQLRKYRPFKKARAFARGLDLRSEAEWRKFCKGKLPEKGALPSDIPANPNQTYADKGWTGMGDWLGTGRIRGSKRKREH